MESEGAGVPYDDYILKRPLQGATLNAGTAEGEQPLIAGLDFPHRADWTETDETIQRR
jgi:hypothetical protein